MQSPMPGRTTGSAPGVTYGTNFKKGGKVKKACSGGKVKKMAKGGSTASKRADGIAQKGKTKGKFV